MTDPAIIFDHVQFAHHGRPPLFDDLCFTMRAGESLGLTGPTGCGKTSLLHLVVGLLKPTQGAVTVFGRPRRDEKDFADVRRRIGLVFQDPDDQLFCPTVLEDVMFGPLNLGATPAEAEQTARRTLAQLGLDILAERITYKLSGGEKRLISLAAVLAMQPDIVLLDEPTNGLDEVSRERLVNHLKSLDRGMLVVSHDAGFLTDLDLDILRMEDGALHSVPRESHEGFRGQLAHDPSFQDHASLYELSPSWFSDRRDDD